MPPASDSPSSASRWPLWMGALAADLRAASAVVLIAALARGCSIWWQRATLDPSTGAGTVVQALVSGSRLDMKVASALVLASAVLSILLLVRGREPAWLGRTRRGLRLGVVLAVAGLTPLLTAVDLAYLGEYGHRFDATLFAAGADDPWAIAVSIWRSYPVLRIILVALPLGAGLAWLAVWASRPRREQPVWLARLAWPGRIAVTTLAIVLAVLFARGSLTRQEWNMQVAATGADPAIDRLIPSPIKALHRGWIDHHRVRRSNGVEWFLPSGDVRGAARRLWGADGEDLDAATARIARGGRPPPPRHVVLVVMESYGAWALSDAWRGLGLAEGMRALGGEGQLLTRFISSGDQTMKSFGAIVSGVPYAGIEIPDMVQSRKPYPSSLPAMFKRLGYRTRCFYAGYASWQRIDELMHEQGFDEVQSGGRLGLDPQRHNEWGLPDHEFLPAVLARLDDAQPTLTVILTVGNHVPFDADLRAAGWTAPPPTPEVAALCDDAWDQVLSGHFWVMDHEFTAFVRGCAARLPGVLVAATGDHYGRRFPNHRPGLAERTLVPFLLWGPGLDRAFPPGQAGSHIDIAPTLVERCAPAGFAYHSFGRDLLSADGPMVGIGQTVAVTADAVVGLPGYGLETEGPGDADAETLRARAADLHAAGWWRAMRGPAWPERR